MQTTEQRPDCDVTGKSTSAENSAARCLPAIVSNVQSDEIINGRLRPYAEMCCIIYTHTQAASPCSAESTISLHLESLIFMPKMMQSIFYYNFDEKMAIEICLRAAVNRFAFHVCACRLY